MISGTSLNRAICWFCIVAMIFMPVVSVLTDIYVEPTTHRGKISRSSAITQSQSNPFGTPGKTRLGNQHIEDFKNFGHLDASNTTAAVKSDRGVVEMWGEPIKNGDFEKGAGNLKQGQVEGWTYKKLQGRHLSNVEVRSGSPDSPGDYYLYFRSNYICCNNFWEVISDPFIATAGHIHYWFDGKDDDEFYYGFEMYEENNKNNNHFFENWQCNNKGRNHDNRNHQSSGSKTKEIPAGLQGRRVRLKVWLGEGGSGDWGHMHMDNIWLSDSQGNRIDMNAETGGNVKYVQSAPLVQTWNAVGAARLTYFHNKPAGTDVIYNITADGENWHTVENGTPIVFDNIGSQLMWNATLRTTHKNIGPYIDKVIVDYDFVGDPEPYKPSSNLWVGSSTPTLEWNFTDPDLNKGLEDEQSEYVVEVYNDTGGEELVYTSGWVNSSEPEHTPGEPIADGIYYWRVRTKDAFHAAGNFSELKRIKIDATKPVGSVVIAEGEESVNEQLVYLRIKASDNGSGIDVMQLINDRGSAQEWEPFKTKKRVALSPTDGPKTIGVRFRDHARIVSVVFEDTIYLDLKGPGNIDVTSPTHPDPERYYKSTSPVFEWKPPYETTKIKGYNYLVDASPMSEPYKDFTNPEPPDKLRTETGEFSGLKDGTWYFHITACDIYNQWSNTSHFRFNIDSAEPMVRETFPEKEWHSETVVEVGAVFEDVSGFGLDVDSIEYALREQDEGGFGIWRDEGITTEVLTRGISDNPVKVRALVEADLPEGADNAVKWRISDLSGNGPVESEAKAIRIDTSPVAFGDPSPEADVVNTDSLVTCGVTVSDDGSGVDGTTIEYAVSGRGDDTKYFKRWTKVNSKRVDGTIKLQINIEFDYGKENYIRWRASDAVGNGPAVSEAFRVWVNSAPVPKISRPAGDAVYKAGEEIALSGVGTEDGEDDELTYRWEIKNRTTKRVVRSSSREEDVVTLEQPGNYLVYLYVNDGHGFNESEKVDITVMKAAGSGTGSNGEGEGRTPESVRERGLVEEWWWLIAVICGILLILLVIPLVIIKSKRRKSAEPKKVGVPKGRYQGPRTDFQRPQPPYPSRQYLSGGRSPSGGGFGVGGGGVPGVSPGGQAVLPGPTSFPGPGARSAQQFAPVAALPPATGTPGQTPARQSTKTEVSYLPPGPGGGAHPTPTSTSSGAPTAQPTQLTPAHSLPTFETDKGAQNLARAALPPAPDDAKEKSSEKVAGENAFAPGTGQPSGPPGTPNGTPGTSAASTPVPPDTAPAGPHTAPAPTPPPSPDEAPLPLPSAGASVAQDEKRDVPLNPPL